MAALTKIKTWAHTNISVPDGSGPTPTGSQGNQDIGNRQLMWEIKEVLIAGNWTVISSSGWNGVDFTAGAGDNWTAASNVNWTISGEHGWIVLQNNAIATGFQILIDLTSSETATEFMDMWVSYASGFTGGSASARPSATDEWMSVNNAQWQSSAADNRGASCFLSSDGECSRIVTSWNSSNIKLWAFEKFASPNPIWVRPALAIAAQNADSGTLSSENIPIETPVGVLNGFFTSSSNGGGSGINTSFLDGVDVGGNWVAPPVGLASKQTSFSGLMARLFDLWFVPSSLADGDYVPSGGSRQYVVLDNLLMPSDGSVVTID